MESKLLNLLKNSNPNELKGFWDELGSNLLGMVVDTGNNLLQTLSLQAAIALAGFGLSGGIPTIGKRQVGDFFEELGNQLLGQLTTAANGLLASLSLTAAQLLASFGLSGGIPTIGKRQAGEFFNELGNQLLGQLTGAANGLLASLSLTAAQLLASFGLSGGIPTIGKRDFWTELGDQLLGQVTTVANGLLGSLSLTAAQLLASFGLSGGIPTIGKRTPEELKGFFDSFINALTDITNTVLLPAINTQLTNVALLGAHVLGGLSQENDIIGTIGTLVGKRSPSELKGIFDSIFGTFTDIINTVLLPAVNTQLTNVALLGAHVLGGLSQENDIIGTIGTLVGKRSQDELKGFFDSFINTLTDITNTVLLPAINTQLTNVALLGAHVLGGLSQENNIIGTIGTLVGKRQAMPFNEWWSQLTASMMSQIQPVLQDTLSNVSLTAAQWLANFSATGGLLG